MMNRAQALAHEIKRNGFQIDLARITGRDVDELRAMAKWYTDKGKRAKQRDLQSLDESLHPGAYRFASVTEEVISQRGYIEDMLSKYGEDDLDLQRVLAQHNVEEILEHAALIESVAALPREITERASGLATYWEPNGVELDGFEWLEIATRVEESEDIYSLLYEYGYQLDYDDDDEDDEGDW